MDRLNFSLDQVDYGILRLMQENARINNADIAPRIGHGSFCDIGAGEETGTKRSDPAI